MKFALRFCKFAKRNFRKFNGLHDRDLLQLAADADASIHDSRKHAMYQHNAGAGSFPNPLSQSQSQYYPGFSVWFF